MDWKEKAIKTLHDSLKPVPHELNDLDWKRDLSPKTEKLAQHISAFANQRGGGFMVFGIYNDGTLFSVNRVDADEIIQKLGNIATNNLNHQIIIEHMIIDYEGYSLLVIYIPEQKDKPIHLKNGDLYDSYCRSAGQTVKMSQQHVRIQAGIAQGVRYEKQIALDHLTSEEVLQLLNYSKAFDLLGKSIPSSNENILNTLKDYNFCGYLNNYWYITNLGAILFANNLKDFEWLSGKTLIIRKYFGTNNFDLDFEHISTQGYAISLDDNVDFIMKHTHKGELREDVRRTYDYIYPKVAIREFVINALIHQDFAILGMQITVEIFKDRIWITNPGAPLNDINRLIDLPPLSRNEVLADMMFLLNFCEKRGSGVDKAIRAIEQKRLPAPTFSLSEVHTRVTMFPAKKLSEMRKDEKILACFQHACLLFEENKILTNQTVRERFGIERRNSATASRIIMDTLNKGLIKQLVSENESKKFASYVPYYGWAPFD